MKKLRDNSVVLALKLDKTMSEWKEYFLEECIKEIIDNRGKSAPTKSIGKYPLLEINSIGGYYPNYKVIRKYVDESTYNNWFRSGHPQAGDILIPTVGTIGIVSMMDNTKACIAQNLIALRIKESISNLFIYYFLKDNDVKKQLLNLDIGGVQPSIKVPHLKKLKILLPPKKIQDKISLILKSLDDKIENNRRVNENLEQQAQALFKSWLKKCEDEVTIGDLSLNITDYTKCEQKQVVLINSSDVTEGRFEHHNLSENKNLKGHFKKRFQKGDILYSQVRPRNRHWGYCTFDADNYLASTQLMVIRNKPELISSILLYQYIIDDKVWLDFTLKTETRSGTFPQGNYEELSSIKVPFGAETSQISSVLENLYSRIFNNEKESNLLSSLRDTLLPKLMSGELRVPDTDLINEMLEKGIR